MAYDTSKLVTLGHLKDLAERVKAGYATQAEFDELEALVQEIVNEGGEPNVIDKILVNGVEQDIENKAVDITVPEKTSELENDSDFQTGDEVQDAIDTAIAESGHAHFEVVDEVPTPEEAEENVLYLVMNESTGYYDIYALIGEEVVRLDDTSVDLEDYVTDEELEEELDKDFSDYYTKEEIDENLEDVLREPDIASDEEVTEMLDEVLGEEDTDDGNDGGDTGGDTGGRP